MPRKPGGRPGDRPGSHRGGRESPRGPDRRQQGRDERPADRRGARGGEGEGTGGSRAGKPRGRRADAPAAPPPEAPVRLQVYLARAGLASRRACEELIREGRVHVNGQPATELGTKVTPGQDRVAVDGKPVGQKKAVWLALNKPRGYVSTRDDPSGRRTVYDSLPEDLHHLFHVGRLDRQSEGLLLFTNEGELANRLLHPRYGIDKEYVATVEGEVTYDALDRLVEGVPVEGETLRAESVEVLPGAGRDGTRLRLILKEGRYREVRRMLEVLGYPVTKLVRRRFGPIRLGKLRKGEWRYLTSQELDQLRGVTRGKPPTV